ncbi:IclR family transcriptional regulator [Aquabacterium sp.]|uniref:IclR family transcriptional regulator n=1 Tax=Aquabacterium sp. TaxID=1872578 RepID=UPI0037848834
MPESEAPATTTGPRVRPVPAVTRSIAILRLLGRTPGPLTLKVIAQELGMISSTALHILRVLVDEGLVKVDPATKRYSLGVGMLALARSVIESHPFPALAQPVLDRLSATWHVTAIGVEIGAADDIVVLALSRSNAPFRLHIDVGSRFPALTSATGRLVAAYSELPRAELERRFRAAHWDEVPDFDSWLKEVEAVRRKGYGLDRGNYINGVAVVAVPVFDRRGRLSHALVAAGVGDQLAGAKAQGLAKDLQDEAQRLSELLAARS